VSSTPSADILFVTDDRHLIALADGGVGGELSAAAVPAEDLLDCLDELTAKIVFLDAEQAEDGTAFAMLRGLAAAGIGIPVVGLCRENQMLDVLAFVRLGARDVLTKPLRPTEVRGSLRRLVPPESP